MANQVTSKQFKIDDQEVTLETGKLARQAHGSTLLKMGETMLLATAVSERDTKDLPFFPMRVDYQENYGAAGRIPGGFIKQEGKPTDHEVLVSRLVDRALRPMFPDDYIQETQVIITLISADDNVKPDALAALAASSALMVSDIPFNGPISEVRVGRLNDKYVINPTEEQLENCDMNLMVAGTKDNVVMVEGDAQECSESALVKAIKKGHEVIKKQCEAQIEFAKDHGTLDEIREYESGVDKDEELEKKVREAATDKVKEVVKGQYGKEERSQRFDAIKDELLENLLDEEEREEKKDLVKRYFHDVESEVVRNTVLEDEARLDGRKYDEIRPLDLEIDYLPVAHGSAVFTRGETQSLATVTLGTKSDEQIIDTALEYDSNDFLLHYYFPPFSTGEAKPLRGPSRREIGHGHLASSAVKAVLPTEEENPYTIRVVSDILESNGSSSMATVCSSSLALMDTGIKLKNHVAGIAMGMIKDKDSGKSAILTDILGDEDHLGDMDFKVAGTSEGITACQMDIKMEGLSYDRLEEALEQAKKARFELLGEMKNVIEKPREELKPHTPRVHKMFIPIDFVGAVIGPGGKKIREMQEESDTTIWVEDNEEHGEVYIQGDNKESIQQVVDQIKGITTIPEVGDVYEGEVKTIKPYGAFVEFLPGKEGLLHISEISWKHIDDVENVFSEGDTVKVKLLDIDRKSGKFKLSRKAILPKPPRKKKGKKSRSKE
jgi:polyribonucleotide nucleotidyltransferase